MQRICQYLYNLLINSTLINICSEMHLNLVYLESEKYRFTRKGMDIYTITLALMQWGDRYLSDDDGPPLTLYHKSCSQRLEPVMRCAQCGEAINARDVIFEDGPAVTNSS
jgi:hypothetical protein